jgi:LuxR family transcriptional regulator, maltose regulon positive regulatory protein
MDEGDDEPVHFWTHVLTALHGTGDEISAAAPQALDGVGISAVDVALPVPVNELGASAVRRVLVPDDYHVLADPRIRAAVEYLVTYLPLRCGW